MADTYILIDKQGQAVRVPENKVQQVAAEHLQRGEDFEIYRAERLRWEISLTPAEPTAAPQRSAGRRAAPAARRSKAAAAAGRVGRPRENLGPCRVPGCDKPQKTRGLCSAHYQQHRRLARKDGRGLIDSEGNLVMRPEIASETAAPRAGRKAGKKAAKKAAKKATRKGARKAGKKAGRKAGRRKAPAAKPQSAPAEAKAE